MRQRIENVFDSLSLGWLSPPAKVLAGIVFLAGLAFIAGVVALDEVHGTATSTESLILPFVAVPVGLAVGLIALIDQLLSQRRDKNAR